MPRKGSVVESSGQTQQNIINILHAELGHSLELISQAAGRAMRLNLIGISKHYKDCALEKAKQYGEKSVEHSKTLAEWLFFNINPLSTPTFRGKKHRLLVIGDNTDFAWSFFLSLY